MGSPGTVSGRPPGVSSSEENYVEGNVAFGCFTVNANPILVGG